MAEAAHALESPWHDLELSGERLQAATTVDQNVLVLAGPGAGKTHLLVGHAVYLARTQPGNVIALTFSRNAARELTERISGKLTSSQRRQVLATTIHSYAFRLLEAHGYRLGLGRPLEILERRDIDALAQEVAAETGEQLGGSTAGRLEKLLRRHALSSQDRAGETFVGRVLARMRDSGRLSWDLCTDLALQLMQMDDIRDSVQHHDRFLLVDEAQDCDRSQFLFLEQLVGGPDGNHMLVAMDPDQSLYAFRDANPEEALRWARKMDPLEVELTESHRCPSRIACLAQAVLGKPVALPPSHLDGEARLFFGSGRAEEAQFVSEHVQQRLHRGVPPERVVVLARSGYLLPAVHEALEARGIPFRLSPKNDFTPVEMQVISLLQLFHDLEEGEPLDPLSVKALKETFKVSDEWLESLESRSIKDAVESPATLVEDWRWRALHKHWTSLLHPSRLISAFAETLRLEIGKELSLQELAGQSRSVAALLKKLRRGHRPTASATGVLVSTFHGSKGLEFDSVFIVGCEDGVIPHYKSTSPDKLLEERRALYVALTRASHEVIITAVKHDGKRKRELSRFLPVAQKKLWTELRGLERRFGS